MSSHAPSYDGQASMRHEDVYGAFICGVQQDQEDPSKYQPLPIPDTKIQILLPPKSSPPSPTTAFPLAGKIFAVKDIYAIAGLTMTVGSKAYLRLQSPATKTAPCIQRLLGAGATLVGMTKTVSFASGMAASDWEDYEAPWNPRGDGNLDPDCSSAGSAVAVAAYEWLDFAVGSDSLGSMIGPAAMCGVFGMRPTHGLLSNEGALPVSSYLDTPGVFTRSMVDLISITKVWYKDPDGISRSPPIRVLYPKGVFEPYVQAKREVMQKALDNLGACFGSMKEIDLQEVWSNGMAAQKKPLNEYLGTTLAHIQLYGSYNNNLQFRKDYETQYGRPPVVDHLIQFKWDLGEKLTDQQLAQALDEREVFRSFLDDMVVPPGTIMVLPGGDPDVRFRDSTVGNSIEVNGRAWQGFGMMNTIYSALGGLPCLSVPVGQRKYIGKDGKPAMQPVSLWIVGPRGSDLWLLQEIAKTLENDKVLTGRDTFAL